MRVLLSIKPEFAEKILTGEKKFEFRRVIHSNKNVHTVVIYMTAPVQRMVGEFEIDRIIEDDPDTIWKNTSHSAGISRKRYDNYFAGRARGYAIGIGRVIKYLNPIDPRSIIPLFNPPQSFMYFPSTYFADRNEEPQQLNFQYL